MKRFSTMLLLAGLMATAACNDSNDDDNTPTTMQASATLNGSQEVPANNSAATGTMTGTYDKSTRTLTYTVTYQGFTPAAGHIHQAPPGQNGGVIVPFSSVATSPIRGTATLTEADAASLMAGNTYVNLHSSTYPNGEIRGNITLK
ncbi:CHRD domain-containing protein [Hymenobacter oligotrophus]|uniref:CHRD domain-containing protein n=1 Tax=Hymenobacter oligotrophus TaxID=2319843 RepID=A0A3B7RF85_9BACT|nr:CHRD domain-containing protein [Hymenobacter oligotrophus]AYA37906.1 CHRD domain-containing protein [Hymenobacter oligotrophus]